MPLFNWMLPGASSALVTLMAMAPTGGGHAVGCRRHKERVLGCHLIIESRREPDLPDGSVLHDFEEFALSEQSIARDGVSIGIGSRQRADHGADRSVLADIRGRIAVERDAARSVVIHVGEVDGDVLDGGVHAVRRGDNMQNMLGRGLIIHAGLELHDPIGSTHLDREKIAVLCESEVVEEIAVGIGGREDADDGPGGGISPDRHCNAAVQLDVARSVVVDIVEIDGDRLGLRRYAVCGRGDVQDVLDRRLIIEAGLEPDLPSGSILHDFEERAGFGKCIARNRVSVAIRGGEDADDGTDRSILPDPQTVRAVEKDFARSMVVHVGYLDDDILNRGGLSVGGGCRCAARCNAGPPLRSRPRP